MKRLLLAALVAGTALGACSKKADAEPELAICPMQPLGLAGEWDWVSTKGGLTGNQTLTPASSGIAIRWVFQADSTCQQYNTQQGITTLVENTTYSLGNTRSIYSGQSAKLLTINRSAKTGPGPSGPLQPYRVVVQTLGTQLVLADNFPDGYTYSYQRR